MKIGLFGRTLLASSGGDVTKVVMSGQSSDGSSEISEYRGAFLITGVFGLSTIPENASRDRGLDEDSIGITLGLSGVV